MAVFVDTSAIIALLVPSDVAHEAAATAFSRLQADAGFYPLASVVPKP
jgi:predicted nucleic acid-binding protein